MDAERMLVVASNTTSPLCTDVPVPTEGRGEWAGCDECGERSWGGGRVFGPPLWCGVCRGHMSLDEVYPFTVAVWQEVCICSHPPSGASVSPIEGVNHASGCPIGVVVAMVEVTGPGHHGSHEFGRWTWCPPKDEDLWHTPTGKVTVLDVPIPMERPFEGVSDEREKWVRVPAGSWWADINMEATDGR